MMRKEIGTYNYGFSIFSPDVMTDFLKSEKIRSKKVLALMQKNKKLFLESIERGIWMPIPSINSGKYELSVEGFDEPFNEEWEQVLAYDGFNIEVKNGLWFTDIGDFLCYNDDEYRGDGIEKTSAYGTKSYYSSKEQWHSDCDGKVHYSGLCYDVADGKYLLSVTGYARKEKSKDGANSGFRFGLCRVGEFTEAKNPREEDYDFNIDWIYTSKKAVVSWLPEKESGVKWPLTEMEFKGSIFTPSGEEKPAYLQIVFDVKNQTENGETPCRVKIWLYKMKEFSLESGKEYPIFQEIYKRGKYINKELGKLVIE